jgi:hypothetical protein
VAKQGIMGEVGEMVAKPGLMCEMVAERGIMCDYPVELIYWCQ